MFSYPRNLYIRLFGLPAMLDCRPECLPLKRAAELAIMTLLAIAGIERTEGELQELRTQFQQMLKKN